jgi:eukaryotic translation initiation factor 2C
MANVYVIIQQLDELSHNARRAAGAPDDVKLSLIVALIRFPAMEIKVQIKQWGDIIRGVPTQCLVYDKAAKANDQYCNNVALK